MKEVVAPPAGVPPDAILSTVQGSGVEEGLLQVLPSVVSNYAHDKTHFFTSARSADLQSYSSFYVTVETAYLTLYANYYQATPHPSTLDVQKIKTDFGKAVEGQINNFSFKPIPPGTTVDMRTGLMWSTDNNCVVNSLQSPQVCGVSQIGGFPLTATCPQGTGLPCQVPIQPKADSEAGIRSWIDTARDTTPQSIWKVPTEGQLRDLLNDRGSDGAAFLRDNAQMNNHSHVYAWTSALWCPQILKSPATDREYVCMSGGSQTTGYDPKVPLRTSYQLTSGNLTTTGANYCRGGPCPALLIFIRTPIPAEYTAYGILKRW